MTAEPKFVPAQGTSVSVGDGELQFQIRLADCVGYVIDGVKGYEDEDGPKYVHTPWHNEPVPLKRRHASERTKSSGIIQQLEFC